MLRRLRGVHSFREFRVFLSTGPRLLVAYQTPTQLLSDISRRARREGHVPVPSLHRPLARHACAHGYVQGCSTLLFTEQLLMHGRPFGNRVRLAKRTQRKDETVGWSPRRRLRGFQNWLVDGVGCIDIDAAARIAPIGARLSRLPQQPVRAANDQENKTTPYRTLHQLTKSRTTVAAYSFKQQMPARDRSTVPYRHCDATA